MKNLTFREKIGYIWDYYRFHIIAIILVLSFAFSMIKHFVTYRDPLLNVIMVNSNMAEDSSAIGFNEFFEKYDYKVYEGAVDVFDDLYIQDGMPSYTDTQYNEVLYTLIAAGDQDLFFGTGEIFMKYAHAGALQDLSEILPQETLAKYEEQLIYTDENGEADSYPCAISLVENDWIKKHGYYNETCYFGIFVKSAHADTATDFAEFLLNYEE